ncbi:MAG: Arginine-tRNA-protein transferase (EC [uncultured Sulfurovum sp.]|uniref:Aspartate/glutamate leucyltransferase n=1 Tax=uncultured Sulfurovum sp. TaxID=269237 RepID=A0A6S6TNM9_9BACT|nr:MAG: Arginine-tRNA-protein transferase (EC [uncultured Sulfurovum sp.]
MQPNPNRRFISPSSQKCSVENKPCSYVEGQKMTMNHRQADVVSKTFVTKVIQHGWKRFGRDYVYPECSDCNACKNLRIKVSDYKYSKSERKIINRNDDTKIVIKEPSISPEHLELYNKYHAYKAKKDGWGYQQMSRLDYYQKFIDGAYDFGKELRYYIDDKLVCVDLIDILDDGISAVYCYYDPDYPRFSLGTYSLLYEINLAENLGLDWVYLGYWIDGYKAFEYKEKFQPLEILDNYPSMVDKPEWKPFKG